jgi:hypothetical protein
VRGDDLAFEDGERGWTTTVVCPPTRTTGSAQIGAGGSSPGRWEQRALLWGPALGKLVRGQRGRRFAIAYRMLGYVREAEDAEAAEVVAAVFDGGPLPLPRS